MTLFDEQLDQTAESEIFNEFRKVYKGRKRGNQTEFLNFTRHKDWQKVLPTLKPLYLKRLKYEEYLRTRGDWIPRPQNLQTFVNNRSWEIEIPKYGEVKPCASFHKVATDVSKRLKPEKLGKWDRRKDIIQQFNDNIDKFTDEQKVTIARLIKEGSTSDIERFVWMVVE